MVLRATSRALPGEVGLALTLRSKGIEIYFWEWEDEAKNLEQAGSGPHPGRE